MTETMQAVGIVEPGGPEVLQPITCEIPQPGAHDVLIEVKAAGINRPDLLQRQGLYPVPPDASPLPGLEVAGEVVAMGSKVSTLDIGDRVMALTHGGGYAEYCRANELHCLRAPANLSDIEAAAIPETFFTVYYNVFTRGALAAGETILIHGGSSGIGTTAIQLAKAHGCEVLVTAGNAKKCKFCLELGADTAINYHQEDWESIAANANGGNGPDVILDMVAGSYMQKNINILARDGRYVIIAFLQGPTAELNMRAVIGKRLTITGSVLRPQTIAEKAGIANDLRKNVLPLLESGSVKPIIYHSFPLSEASRAHEMMESSHHMGKIVLKVA
jgi:putative PIG3 family NAD(P)H quinone oxidoreductase